MLSINGLAKKTFNKMTNSTQESLKQPVSVKKKEENIKLHPGVKLPQTNRGS